MNFTAAWRETDCRGMFVSNSSVLQTLSRLRVMNGNWSSSASGLTNYMWSLYQWAEIQGWRFSSHCSRLILSLSWLVEANRKCSLFFFLWSNLKRCADTVPSDWLPVGFAVVCMICCSLWFSCHHQTGQMLYLHDVIRKEALRTSFREQECKQTWRPKRRVWYWLCLCWKAWKRKKKWPWSFGGRRVGVLSGWSRVVWTQH